MAKKEDKDVKLKKLEDSFRLKGKRRCKRCGTVWGLIRKYSLYICRRCFREVGEELGFHKYH